jgi:hypothetical protein
MVFGAVSAVGYLEFIVSPTAEDLFTVASYFLPAVFVALIVQIFLLVLCLRPSKSKEDGNRYTE